MHAHGSELGEAMGKETQTPVEGLLLFLRPQREFCSGLACSCTLGEGSRCLEIPRLLRAGLLVILLVRR